jgi:hypothetical protein
MGNQASIKQLCQLVCIWNNIDVLFVHGEYCFVDKDKDKIVSSVKIIILPKIYYFFLQVFNI